MIGPGMPRWTRSALERYGFRAWDEPDANGNTLMLVPKILAPAIDPAAEVETIDGKKHTFAVALAFDGDERYGCLAYGFRVLDDLGPYLGPGGPGDSFERLIADTRRALEQSFPAHADLWIVRIERALRRETQAKVDQQRVLDEISDAFGPTQAARMRTLIEAILR